MFLFYQHGLVYSLLSCPNWCFAIQGLHKHAVHFPLEIQIRPSSGLGPSVLSFLELGFSRYQVISVSGDCLKNLFYWTLNLWNFWMRASFWITNAYKAIIIKNVYTRKRLFKKKKKKTCNACINCRKLCFPEHGLVWWGGTCWENHVCVLSIFSFLLLAFDVLLCFEGRFSYV